MISRAALNRAGVDAARTWYRIENKADTAEVFLYDEIGAWGTTAGDFAKELADVTAKSIDLRISSAGGEVFDGLAIYAALQRHPAKVTVHIDGLAASIASVIAMAGDDIVIDRYAQMMIHEAHAIACGSTKDMTAMASLLNEYSDNIAAIYASRAGGDTTQWRERMKAETWFSAAEAVKAGLADRMAEAMVRGKPAATWDLSMFNHAGRDHAPDPFPNSPAETVPPVITSMACPMHETSTAEGAWDAAMHEGRMPSPMSTAMAEKFYAWYDPGKVENGTMPKSAGKLPHHEVGEDGTPGPANLAAVRAALTRLSDIPEADVEAVRAHLNAHLGAAQDIAFDPDVFRMSMAAALRVEYDPAQIRDLMASVARDAPAAPVSTPALADLGPLPEPAAPVPEPEPNPWDAIRVAVRMAADDAPAPPEQTQTPDPADEPDFFMDAQAFRTALRRATL
jgi:ATP-dependent protease ClpP protease subunit